MGPIQEIKDCNWIKRFIINDKNPFPNAQDSVFQLMVQELGGADKKGKGVWDQRSRLAAFLTSSNRLKGTLFGGGVFQMRSDFDTLQPGDEQIMHAKRLGMIFAYMNHPDIWQSFCDSYNGMLTVLMAFQLDYNTANPQDRLDFVDKWQSFVRSELKRVVERGQAAAMSMYNGKKDSGDRWNFWWTAKWWTIYKLPFANQYSYIALDRTCQNLQ